MSEVEPFVLDFEAVFDKFISTQEKVWKHDRALTVGASEAFDCLRKVGFKKRGKEQGYEPDPGYVQSWGALHRGNVIENHLVAPAMAHLPEPLGALYVEQKNQETFVSGRNSATPDGLLTGFPLGRPVLIKYRNKEILIENHTGSIGLEVKSIDPRTNLHEEKAKHHGQSQIGLGIIREKGEFSPLQWIILYVNASFYDDITPFVVEWNPVIYESAKLRAAIVFNAEDVKKLPPEGKFESGGCDYCEYTVACGIAEHSRWKKLRDEPVNDAEAAAIEPDVQAYLDAKEAVKDAERNLSDVVERLKQNLDRLGKKKVKGPNWSVSWSFQNGRTSLDKAALEADGIDLAKYTKVGNPFEVFRVT